MFNLTLNLIGTLAFLGALGLLKWQRYLLPLSRNQIVGAGTAWVLAATATFWIVGPYSQMMFQGDSQLLSLWLYLNAVDVGKFSHEISGGNDIYALAVNTGQYLSLEKGLLSVFPLWAAYAAHKIFLCALGFIGTYLICRRMAKTGRPEAFGLAALFTLSHPRVITMDFHHGLGFGLVPLAIYLCVGRIGRRYYLTGVLTVAILNAVSSSPTHSNLSLFAAVFLVAVFCGWRQTIQVTGALAILAICLLANWHESLYAKYLIGPWSFRGAEDVKVTSLQGTIDEIYAILSHSYLLSIVAFASLGLLVFTNRRRFFSAALLFLSSLISGPLVWNLPWEKIGLGMLKGFSFSNFSHSIYPVAAYVAAQGFAELQRLPTFESLSSNKLFSRRTAAITLTAIAMADLAWITSYSSATWLSEGGQPVVWSEYEALVNRQWNRDNAYRVASINHRLVLTLPAAAGMRTIDGVYHLYTKALAQYWRQAVGQEDFDSGFITFTIADYKCCDHFNMGDLGNIDLLRLGNVGYLLSALPVQGDRLTLVEGPASGRIPPRNTEPKKDRILHYIEYIREPGKPYVYALPTPTPMVFAAQSIDTLPLATDIARFYKLAAENALRSDAVMWENDPLASNLRAAARPTAKLLNWQLVKDGFDVTLDAPEGGVVVFNTPYLPFWQAETDVGPVTAVSAVNGIHFGVAVPSGAQQLTVRYKRPMLREIIGAWATKTFP